MSAILNYVITGLMLFISFSTSAQTLPGPFEKSWGPGTLAKTANQTGAVQHQTDGKGNPDFLVAPLKKSTEFVGKNIYFEIKIDKMMNFSGFEIRLGDKEFNNYYALSIPSFADQDFNIIQDDYWQSYSFGLSNARIVGKPRNKVQWLGVYIQDNAKGHLKISFRNIRFNPAPVKGYVSLTFDDGYLDHYYAAKIMHNYNIPGTAYVMPRQVGQSGYMNLQQIKELKSKYHWGISSHHEIPYTEFEPYDLIKEIKFTIKFLADNGFQKTALHLAYPLGKQDREIVLPSVRKYFETARVAGGGVETLPPADPHLLRTFNVLDTTKPHELVKVVKNAVENGQWAILMFHYLVDQPKTDTEYRKEDFVKFIQLLAQSDVPVLTVDEVYRKFQSTMSARNATN